nr:putative ribonuclease H-like domain-containing protein [Tanacetum cinerariifolium]
MTGNKAHLAGYQDFKGGFIAFGGSNGRITGKGKIKAGKLDFEDVYYVEELKHYNLFYVSQIYDTKNKVLFTDTDCLVMSLEFKLPDENQVLLKIPRQHNMYSFNLKNIDPSGYLACSFAKALIDESNKWHRRLGHVNFKNLNKLVKGNLVRGLPSMIFENDHIRVACQKGKQHKASCKAKIMSSVNQPLQILHMDLFGLTSVRSINHKTYSLVITDGFSRLKGSKREYSNARTLQQNEVAEKKNETLIDAARTMLADSFLPTTFWVEAVNTACYVLNRVLVTKPQNKTPYDLLTGKEHAWMFDLDYLTNSMNYEPVSVENQANKSLGPKEANNSAGTQDNDDQSANSKEIDLHEEHFVLPIWSAYSTTVKSSGNKTEKNTDYKTREKPVSQVKQIFLEELKKLKRQEKEANDAAELLRKEATHDIQNDNTSSTNPLNTVSIPLNCWSFMSIP